MNAASVVLGASVRHGFHDPAYFAATGEVHQGADLEAPIGTPVVSPVSGTVTFAGWDDASGAGGNGVKIAADRDGASVGFWHLSSVAVGPGQRVGVGDLVGYSGQSGGAVYAHTHLQVELPPGSPIDPIAYLAGLDAAVGLPPDGGGAGDASTGIFLPVLALVGAALLLWRLRD